MKIVIGTRNKGKLREISRELNVPGLEILSLADFKDVTEPMESGATYLENAILKASFYAKQTGNFTLADDSGLEVLSLDNQPGILSSRFGGEGSSYESKIKTLLGMLSNSEITNRAARFICAMAVADNTGAIIFRAQGICDGSIAGSPRGNGGFGYDPIFIPSGCSATFGELDEIVKQKISHRAIALKKIISFLSDFSASSLDS
jgi:XTP/dITP diphosphohydrolase